MRPVPRPAPDPTARTYIAFAYDYATFGVRRPPGGRARYPVIVLGMVRARSLAEARDLGDALAERRLAARGHSGPERLLLRVRVQAGGVCRRAWLLEALAQDGAALLAADFG